MKSIQKDRKERKIINKPSKTSVLKELVWKRGVRKKAIKTYGVKSMK